LLVTLLFGGSAKVPWTFEKDIASPIDDAIDWIQRNHGDSLATFSDKVVVNVVRIQDLLGTSITWPVLIIGVAVLGLVLRGWAFALFCAIGLVGIGMLGMWTWSITTLSQIIVAVAIGMVIALPIGIFIGRRGRLESAVEPILDALQTLPSFIYAIPFVMLFRLNYVPAIMATMLYAIPAGIRLSALAMKTVPSETLEAATTFGATNRQRLWGVHIPLARRGLVLAVNQLIMMSISMAIIAGQIGENGLGYKSVEALTKPDVGVGIEAGLALLVMAIILDRMMEGLANKFDTAPVAEH
jgi:glycine betaine/proline transport system permease protein